MTDVTTTFDEPFTIEGLAPAVNNQMPIEPLTVNPTN